jgi:multiple sugar transport system permease protein
VLAMKLWPSEWRWSNFTLPFKEAPFARYYLNSVVVGVSVTLLNVITCTLAGYSFAKFDYRGRNVLFFLVLATLMIPLEVIYVPLYALVFKLGWVNSFAGLIIPSGTSAFGIFLMRQSMESVPDELIDAARIDGAGELRIYTSIVLPTIVPILATLGIWTFLSTWNDFMWPLIVLSDEARWTLPVALANLSGEHVQDTELMMAGSVLTILPVMLVFLFLQRYYIQGVMVGSVKG